MKKVNNIFPKIDHLIFSIGIFEESNIFSITVEDLEKSMNVNLFSIVFLLKGLLKNLQQGSGKSVVFISSFLGTHVDQDTLIYSMTKSALNSFTKSMALELAKYSIRVNSVSPSFVETDMVHDFLENENIKDKIIKKHPLGRIGKATDISYLVLFLLSDYASWITAQNVVIDGGRSVRC